MENSTLANLLNWTTTFGPFLQFYVQIFFWIALSLSALVATCTFRRFVKDRRKADAQKLALHVEHHAVAESPNAAVQEPVVTPAQESTVDVSGFID